MHKEYFEILHRFHSHKDSVPIRTVTRIQMEQLQRTCPAWMLRHVNRFLKENFPPPESMTG